MLDRLTAGSGGASSSSRRASVAAVVMPARFCVLLDLRAGGEWSRMESNGIEWNGMASNGMEWTCGRAANGGGKHKRACGDDADAAWLWLCMQRLELGRQWRGMRRLPACVDEADVASAKLGTVWAVSAHTRAEGVHGPGRARGAAPTYRLMRPPAADPKLAGTVDVSFW